MQRKVNNERERGNKGVSGAAIGAQTARSGLLMKKLFESDGKFSGELQCLFLSLCALCSLRAQESAKSFAERFLGRRESVSKPLPASGQRNAQRQRKNMIALSEF